jgi:excisionase family DNA binding protein
MTAQLQSSNDNLLRKKQVAEKLACSLRTVDRLVNAGKLTRVKILGGIRFRLSQVQMLMNGGNHDFQS